jgi:hypothetical protein
VKARLKSTGGSGLISGDQSKETFREIKSEEIF